MEKEKRMREGNMGERKVKKLGVVVKKIVKCVENNNSEKNENDILYKKL
jgi:hypothetical protein